MDNSYKNDSKDFALKVNSDYSGPQDKMSYLPNYYRWMYSYVNKFLYGAIADLGCGAGHGIRFYSHKVDEIFAIDHDSRLLNTLSDNYPNKKITPLKVDLLQDWGALNKISVNHILMMDLVEHFEDDVGLLVKSRGILKSGGTLFFKVPAHRRFYGEVDKSSGHFRRYDKRDVLGLAERAGFEVEAINKVNPLAAIAYRLRRTRRSSFSMTFSNRQLRWINRAIPVIKGFDKVPLMPGLSFIVRVRKP